MSKSRDIANLLTETGDVKLTHLDNVPASGTTYFEQTTAPIGEPNGTFWLDTDDEILYQLQSSEWIQVSTAATPTIGTDSPVDVTGILALSL